MTDELGALSRRRWKVALGLTGLMLGTYFGFILSVAYARETLGRVIAPGLSVGIAAGALVILVAFALTGLYVRWANTVYDRDLAKVREKLQSSDHAEAKTLESAT